MSDYVRIEMVSLKNKNQIFNAVSSVLFNRNLLESQNDIQIFKENKKYAIYVPVNNGINDFNCDFIAESIANKIFDLGYTNFDIDISSSDLTENTKSGTIYVKFKKQKLPGSNDYAIYAVAGYANSPEDFSELKPNSSQIEFTFVINNRFDLNDMIQKLSNSVFTKVDTITILQPSSFVFKDDTFLLNWAYMAQTQALNFIDANKINVVGIARKDKKPNDRVERLKTQAELEKEEEEKRRLPQTLERRKKELNVRDLTKDKYIVFSVDLKILGKTPIRIKPDRPVQQTNTNQGRMINNTIMNLNSFFSNLKSIYWHPNYDRFVMPETIFKKFQELIKTSRYFKLEYDNTPNTPSKIFLAPNFKTNNLYKEFARYLTRLDKSIDAVTAGDLRKFAKNRQMSLNISGMDSKKLSKEEVQSLLARKSEKSAIIDDQTKNKLIKLYNAIRNKYPNIIYNQGYFILPQEEYDNFKSDVEKIKNLNIVDEKKSRNMFGLLQIRKKEVSLEELSKEKEKLRSYFEPQKFNLLKVDNYFSEKLTENINQRSNIRKEIILEDHQDFHKEFGYLGYIENDKLWEAEYQGKKVKLNKPIRSGKKGPKKFHVYVKNNKGNVVKVNFGDPNMKIKKYDPKRRKSFRARHRCKTPGPKTSARYWSCKAW